MSSLPSQSPRNHVFNPGDPTEGGETGRCLGEVSHDPSDWGEVCYN